jgi:hypothetical protein
MPHQDLKTLSYILYIHVYIHTPENWASITHGLNFEIELGHSSGSLDEQRLF